MKAYKITFTILDIIFILVVGYAQNRSKRDKFAWIVYTYIMLTNIGCVLGMWL